jgi:ABC-type nitrate/sulfonate/bicarbonate transport system permease component
MFSTLFSPFSTGRKISIKFIAIVQIIILAGIWIAMPNSTGIPSPTSIFQAWNELALKQGLLLELVKSVVVIWEALILSAIISFGVAYLTTADVFKPAGTMIASLRFLGFAGLTFLFTLWTSNGQNLKLALLTFGMTVFLTRSTIDEMKSIPLESIDYARSLGMKGWRITYEIGVRGRLHVMLDLLRQNAAIGWTLIVMVEGLVRSDGGIGALLLIQGKYFNLSSVFAIQLTILFYGIVQDVMLNLIRSMLCPYSNLNRSDR